MSFLTDDPVRAALNCALAGLDAGRSGHEVESDEIDCKEDPSKRDRIGNIIEEGPSSDERAAVFLADEAACMANSGGGGLVVGVEDKTGCLVGTQLDQDWLRQRIYEITDRRLTCSVEEVLVAGHRLLAVISPRALERIQVRGRARHRVNRQCVEIDASSWASNHLRRLGYDWSGQPSSVPRESVRAGALEQARRYLLDSGEQRAVDLARSSDDDLLRRLAVLEGRNVLTNAGALLFTAAAARPLLDYRRRQSAGGDSTFRYDRGDVSLLEALSEVEQAVGQTNRVVHSAAPGLAVGQVRGVPEKAVREALANAVAHRDWGQPDPIVIEFAGDTLVLQSPGGFLEGVDADKLLTTPPKQRNRALASALRSLRITEGEGIGVDRMYREMIRVGHQPPTIVERTGPHVRCALVGGDPDEATLRLVTELDPPERFDDLDVILLVDALKRRPTIDAEALSEVLQKSVQEASAVLGRAATTRFRGLPLVAKTARARRYRSPDYRFGDSVREHFGIRLSYIRSSVDDAAPHVIDFVRRHGRIASRDYAEIFGVSAPHASTMLSRFTTDEGDRTLSPGKEPNVGRDAHYVAGPNFPAG